MKSNVLLLVVLGVITISTIQLSHAIEPTQVTVTTINTSVIDLNSEEKDRKIHSFAEFENFDTQNSYFVVNVIQLSTGQIIKEFQITVQSTDNGSVDFLSQVIFLVSDEMIITGQINPGNYEMQIATTDGSATAVVPFSIIDTRE